MIEVWSPSKRRLEAILEGLFYPQGGDFPHARASATFPLSRCGSGAGARLTPAIALNCLIKHIDADLDGCDLPVVVESCTGGVIGHRLDQVIEIRALIRVTPKSRLGIF